MKQADLFDIRGHVALVTGAARGLGLAFAEVMAENGAMVVLTDIDAANLEKQASRLAAKGCAVEQAAVDVADTERLRAAIDGAAERHGRLDAVFANAGISAGPGFAAAPSGQLEAIDVAAFERVVRINLTAAMLTMKHAVPHMKRRQSGSLIATTSIAGLGAEPAVGYGYVPPRRPWAISSGRRRSSSRRTTSASTPLRRGRSSPISATGCCTAIRPW